MAETTKELVHEIPDLLGSVGGFLGRFVDMETMCPKMFPKICQGLSLLKKNYINF